jgi:hypothetical protein
VVTVNADVLVVVPAGVSTVIEPPVAPAGTVAVTEESEATAKGIVVPFKRTAVAPLKPVPRITTRVPEGPLIGPKEKIDGPGVVSVVVVVTVPVVIVVVVTVPVVFVVSVVVTTFAPAPPTPQRPVATPAAAIATSARQPLRLMPATALRAYNYGRRPTSPVADDAANVMD